LASLLVFLKPEDPDKDIYLYVNSPGGSVSNDGPPVFLDTQQHIKPDVQTVLSDWAASMGAFPPQLLAPRQAQQPATHSRS